MKLFLNLFAATILALAMLPPTGAYAGKMDGKGGSCSDRSCRGINASSSGQTKTTKKPTTQH